MPLKLGVEGSGIVAAIGSGVESFKVGDAVYGLGLSHPMLPNCRPGFCSDYAIIRAHLLLPKPAHVSFEEAASMVGSTITALQTIRKGIELNPGAFLNNTLEGKTVMVTAALGAASAMAAQVAKNHFGAKVLITAVSTAKIPLLEQYMPGVIDRAIDYQKQDLISEVGKGKIDLLYNSRSDVTSYFPLVEPTSGVIASILSVPRSATMKKALGAEFLPFWLAWILDLAQLWYKWKLSGTNIKMDFVSGNSAIREDLEKAGELIATGKVKAVITVVSFEDIEAIRRGCENVHTGKGGLGKLVVKIV